LASRCGRGRVPQRGLQEGIATYKTSSMSALAKASARLSPGTPTPANMSRTVVHSRLAPTTNSSRERVDRSTSLCGNSATTEN
jgi:hypothetical protein